MKKVSFLIALTLVLNANAQDYLITFAGTGASSSVNKITIENLTSGTSIILNGNDLLHLKGLITGIVPEDNDQASGIKIYPNPMVHNSTLEILPPVAGEAVISIYDMAGKLVAQDKSYLENTRQEFRLSGTKKGIYLLQVSGDKYKLSQKFVCNGESAGVLNIEKAGIIVQNRTENTTKSEVKGIQSTVEMKYTAGDRLRFTGVSDIYTTIIMDVPTVSKLVTFTFVACTDGEGNNYPVIQIGTGKSAPQIWMAANLRSTKFNDGSDIPLVTDKTSWSTRNTSAYCWYNNNSENHKASYGALYNWHTVSSGNLCPSGWHVPDFDEWKTLADFLGGSNLAGGKLKETGTLHWISPNSGASDAIGFAALPGGFRNVNGNFEFIGTYCKLWLSTKSDITNAYCQFLNNCSAKVDLGLLNKKAGLTVRCLKN